MYTDISAQSKGKTASAKLGHIANITDHIFPKSLVGGMSGRHISEIIKSAYGSAGVFKTDIKGFFRNVKKPHLKRSLMYAAKKIILAAISECLFAAGASSGPVITAYSPFKLTFSDAIAKGEYRPVSLNDSTYATIVGAINPDEISIYRRFHSRFRYMIHEAARLHDIAALFSMPIDVSELFKNILTVVNYADYAIVDPDIGAETLLKKYELSDTARALISDILKDVLFKISSFAKDVSLEFMLAQNRYGDCFTNKMAFSKIHTSSNAHNNLLETGLVSAVIDHENITKPESCFIRNILPPSDLDSMLTTQAFHFSRTSYATSALLFEDVMAIKNATSEAGAALINKLTAYQQLTDADLVINSIPIIGLDCNNRFLSAMYSQDFSVCAASKELTHYGIITKSISAVMAGLNNNITDNATLFLGKQISIKNYLSVNDLAGTDIIRTLHCGTYKYEYKNSQRYCLAGLHKPAVDIITNPIRRSSFINYLRHLSDLITKRCSDGMSITGRISQALGVSVAQGLSGAHRIPGMIELCRPAHDDIGIQTFGHKLVVNAPIIDNTGISAIDCIEQSNTILITDPTTGELKTAIIAPFAAGYAIALANMSDESARQRYIDKANYIIDMHRFFLEPRSIAPDTNGNLSVNVLRGSDNKLKPDVILLPYLGKILSIAVTDEMLQENKINFYDVVATGAYTEIIDDRETKWHTQQVIKAIDLSYDYMIDYYTTANNSLPEGAVTSPLLANYVLAEIADMIRDDIRALDGELYAYVDDISVIFKNKLPDACKARAVKLINAALAAKGLDISYDKTKLIRGKYKRELFGVTFLPFPGANANNITIRLRRADHMLLRQQIYDAIKFVKVYTAHLNNSRTMVPTDEYIAQNYPKSYDKRSHMRLPRILNKINGKLAWAISLSPERYSPLKQKLLNEAIGPMKSQIMPMIKEITAGFVDLASMASRQGMDDIESMLNEECA